jgi:hypothetical protein
LYPIAQISLGLRESIQEQLLRRKPTQTKVLPGELMAVYLDYHWKSVLER